eukprot:6175436-Pleurochrysis_carterae.AAC.2
MGAAAAASLIPSWCFHHDVEVPTRVPTLGSDKMYLRCMQLVILSSKWLSELMLLPLRYTRRMVSVLAVQNSMKASL